MGETATPTCEHFFSIMDTMSHYEPAQCSSVDEWPEKGRSKAMWGKGMAF
jgi:hypothetical protein